MWILNWLPDAVFDLILIAGVVAVLVSWCLRQIPFVSQYLLPIQVAGVVLTIVGVWYQGGIAKDAEWRARVAELEVKLAQAESKSATENVKIVTKIVKQLELVKTRGADVVQYIDREIVKYDTVCPIPREVVEAHNRAAAPVGEIK